MKEFYYNISFLVIWYVKIQTWAWEQGGQIEAFTCHQQGNQFDNYLRTKKHIHKVKNQVSTNSIWF